jgi:uncharacterized protein YPO0396
MAVRVTISIPEDLKKRMDRTKEDINWSSVAAIAFETRVKEVEQKMQQQSIEKLVIKVRQRTSLPATRTELKSVAEMREQFIEKVIFQAEWREGKAEQHPRDHRNMQSAEALRALATELDQIAPNDALWIRYYRVWQEIEDGTGAIEEESESLRGFGFHEAVSVTAREAVAFLRDSVELCERLRAEEQSEG